MAAFQYYLEVIPLQGIRLKHHSIPNSLKINTTSGYFQSEAKHYWKLVHTNINKLLPQIDTIVDRADWGDNKIHFQWKTYTDILDNDAAIFLNKDTLNIENFHFRIDLREKQLTFLNHIIELGILNQWMFIDRKGTLMPPEFNIIKKSIKISDAYRFLRYPNQF